MIYDDRSSLGSSVETENLGLNDKNSSGYLCEWIAGRDESNLSNFTVYYEEVGNIWWVWNEFIWFEQFE